MDRILAPILSFVLAVMGVAFLLAQPRTPGRGLIGGTLIVIAVILLLLVFRRRQAVIIQQKLDIGGIIAPAILKCRNCGAELSRESISVKEGDLFTQCPYCHTSFQLQEEPKW